MPNFVELEKNIKSIIDDLQGLCSTNGLSNTAYEEVVVTTVFLYKFLNDKFVANLKKFCAENDLDYDSVIKNEDDMLDAFYDSYPQDVAFKYEDTIEYLVQHNKEDNFYKQFDDTLVRISSYKENEAFSVETAGGEKKPLFTEICDKVEASRRNAFARNIFSYITRDRFDFGETIDGNYDFFSTIFEYLIQNYNVASGTYAEYFTPQALSKAIAQILVHMAPVEDKIYEVYDPSAGSGSLVLHLANELGDGKFGNKARVYTQDISQKSSRFLRINMLLNGLKESLENIIEGDTLETPSHFRIKGDDTSGVKKFDFITSNPPFKTDFSSTRDKIEDKWKSTTRFFAGVPKIPNTKKESTEKIKSVETSLKSEINDFEEVNVEIDSIKTSLSEMEQTIDDVMQSVVEEDENLQNQINAIVDSLENEWIALTIADSFAAYDGLEENKPMYKLSGHTVEVKGCVVPLAEFTSSTEKVVFASGLPEGLCPSSIRSFICQGSGMNRWLLTVETDGTLTISRYGVSECVAVPTTEGLSFSGTYMI